MTCRADNSAGFTLVELLIALALLGFLSVGMAGGLAFGLRSWRHAHHFAATSARIAAVRSALAGLIGNARPDYVSSNRFDNRLFFEGKPDELRFLAPLPEAVEHDVIAIQSLHLVPGPTIDSKILMLDWMLNLPGFVGRPPTAASTLVMEDVSGITFRYWGRMPSESIAAWHDNWINQAQLPTLVHVEITSRNGPRLFFDTRLLASVPVSCVYDPVSLRCIRQP